MVVGTSELVLRRILLGELIFGYSWHFWKWVHIWMNQVISISVMDRKNMTTEVAETHLTSAVAFVEGGIQEACEDACSICLEPFCEDDPSTVTSCKHEYHLQCILEWCQRSKQCPMCWQLLSLKDPASQELLAAVEQERAFQMHQPQNAPNFPHSSFEDFNLHNVQANTDDSDFEERIMEHLAAAAGMGRSHQFARRETSRNRSSGQGHPQILVFSTHPNMPRTLPTPNYIVPQGGNLPTLTAISPTIPFMPAGVEQVHRPWTSPSEQVDSHSTRSTSVTARAVENRNIPSLHRNTAGQPSVESQERSGPSENQSFSETLKSRFSIVSSRYKESISKTARGFKEKLWARNNSVSELGREVQREVSAGIAGVARMMERLDPTGKNRGGVASASVDMEGSSAQTQARQCVEENSGNICSGNAIGANACNTSSVSSRVAPQPLNDESSSSMDVSSLKDVEDNSGGGTGVQYTPAGSSP